MDKLVTVLIALSLLCYSGIALADESTLAWEGKSTEVLSSSAEKILMNKKVITTSSSVLRFTDRCLRWLTPAERDSPELKAAMERYHRACPSCQIQVKCDECTDRDTTGFFRSQGRCGAITLCTNNGDRYLETLIHELTHARRFCQSGESITCEDNLCDELAAYQETGQCSLETPTLPSDGDFYTSPRERYLCCVQACGSVEHSSSCNWDSVTPIPPERIRELMPAGPPLPRRPIGFRPCESFCLALVESGQCYSQGHQGTEPCYADDGTGKTFHPYPYTEPLEESHCEELCEARFNDAFLRGDYWLIPIGCVQRLCRVHNSDAPPCSHNS